MQKYKDIIQQSLNSWKLILFVLIFFILIAYIKIQFTPKIHSGLFKVQFNPVYAGYNFKDLENNSLFLKAYINNEIRFFDWLEKSSGQIVKDLDLKSLTPEYLTNNKREIFESIEFQVGENDHSLNIYVNTLNKNNINLIREYVNFFVKKYSLILENKKLKTAELCGQNSSLQSGNSYCINSALDMLINKREEKIFYVSESKIINTSPKIFLIYSLSIFLGFLLSLLIILNKKHH